MATITWSTNAGLPINEAGVFTDKSFNISGTQIPSNAINITATLSVTGTGRLPYNTGGTIYTYTAGGSRISSVWSGNITVGTVTIEEPSKDAWGLLAERSGITFYISGSYLLLTAATLTITYDTSSPTPTPTGRKFPYATVNNLTYGHTYFLVASVRTDDASSIISGNSYAHPDIVGSTLKATQDLSNDTGTQVIGSIVKITTAPSSESFCPLSVYNVSNVDFYTYYMAIFDLTNLGLEDTIRTVSSAIDYFGITTERVGYYYTLDNTLDFSVPREIYVPATKAADNIGVYNIYWKDYISDVYSVNTRVMEAYVYLDNIDDTFHQFFYYDNTLWMLSKVVDWSMDTKKCKGTFIKVNDKENYIGEQYNIYYTSVDSRIVTPHTTTEFGANLISNTYKNGIGILSFDGPVTEIGDDAFLNCYRLLTISIPSTVTEIGTYAFSGCTRLKSVNIPTSVQTIYDNAFENTALTSLNIPYSVTHIGDYVISGCNISTLTVDEESNTYYSGDSNSIIEKLTGTLIVGCKNTVIPATVNGIYDRAFYRCPKITSITIPSSVTTIGDEAFRYCPSLSKVYCTRVTVPSLGTNAFDNNASGRKIVVPCESASLYKAATNWSDYASDIVGDCTHNITTTVSSGEGTITGGGEVEYEETRVITITPGTGYKISTFTDNGVDVKSSIVNNTYTLRSVTIDHTLIVSFELITYTITGTVSSGTGTITGTGDVTYGGTKVITLTPGEHYKVSTFTDNGVDVKSSIVDNTYTLTNVTENHTLVVSFELVTYTVTTRVSSGTGTITGGGTVAYGGSMTVTITPAEHYKVYTFTDNGVDVKSSIVDNTYTLSNVSADHTLIVSFTLVTYNITGTVSSGQGTITGTGEVAYGSSKTVTINPGTGYKISTFTDNGVDVKSSIVNNTYTLSNVTTDHSLVVAFELITYTVTGTVSSGTGTITGTGDVTYGGTKVITLTPGTGYKVSTLTDNGVDVKSSIVNNTYTLTNVTTNHNLVVSFVVISCEITGTVSSGTGTITGTGTVTYGGSKTVTITPGSHYEISTFTDNGVDVKSSIVNNTYTLTNITTDHTLIVSFTLVTYTVTGTVSSGTGTITGTGTVSYGGTKVITLTPGTGYKISTLTDNGVDVKSSIVNNTYTLTNVTTNHSLVVSFEKIIYTITGTVSSGTGTITGTGTVAYGGTKVITLTPGTGYKVSTLTDNGVDVKSSIVNNKYTLSNVSANHTLVVSFDIITYSITGEVTFGGQGTITGTGTVSYGGTKTVTITPGTGYKIHMFTDNGVDVKSSIVDNTYTLTNITADHNLVVVFNLITPPLTFTANSAGSVRLYRNGSGTSYVSLYYSTDDINWNYYTIGDRITLSNAGDYVMFKGDNNSFSTGISNYYYFDISGSIAASGDVMSLLDSTCQSVTIPNSYCFYKLFGLGGGTLTTAPDLPATTLTDWCYEGMFDSCISLTTAPALPATALAYGCYASMFLNCQGLITAPALPATALAENCYSGMFQACYSLTTAPALPATALAENCYEVMFADCRALTTAPELPATTLVNACYYQMFYGCTSLNYIKALFTTTPSSTYTDDWVKNVASTGTFVKSASATWSVRGTSGIPTNWTVQTQ